MQYRHVAAATAMGRAALLNKPKYMILHVNSVCNAKCRMCFTWDGMMERWDAKGISLENLEKLAASMNPLPQLTMSGGEPLLRRDLPQIIEGFYRRAGTRFFTVPTNSLKPDRVERLARYFIEHCPKGFLNFCLPFHGADSHFDNIMGVEGAFAKFKETYAVLEEIRGQHENISIILNFVMSKFNYTEYRSIIDMAYDDFPSAPIGIAYCRGVTHEDGATDVPIDVYREAQAYLGKRKRNHARYNPYTIMFESINDQVCAVVSDVVNGDLTNLKCGAGRHLLVTYDDGQVFPCELIDAVGMPKAKDEGESAPTHSSLGNLADFDFDMSVLLKSDPAREVTRWIASHDCACTWECAIYSKVVHSPLEVAKLGANVARYLLKETARPLASAPAGPAQD